MTERSPGTTQTLLQTRRFRVESISEQHTDGSIHQREVVRHPGAVTIIPMVDADHVCLIRNFRIAVDDTLIELPAGTRDRPDEPPADTASRELIEETGYRAGRIELLHQFYLSPGILDEQMFLFLAQDLTAGQAEREPGEQIQNLVTPWEQALAWVHDGQIRDAKTIVGLLLFDRVKRQL